MIRTDGMWVNKRAMEGWWEKERACRVIADCRWRVRERQTEREWP